MICDLSGLLKIKYVSSILIISEIINVLSKHNQKFSSPSQERFSDSAWSSVLRSSNSFIGILDRLENVCFYSQVLVVFRENRAKTCSDRFGAKSLKSRQY